MIRQVKSCSTSEAGCHFIGKLTDLRMCKYSIFGVEKIRNFRFATSQLSIQCDKLFLRMKKCHAQKRKICQNFDMKPLQNKKYNGRLLLFSEY